MKPPVWKQNVLKVSYSKTYSLEDVQRDFNEQEKVSLKIIKSFSGTKEIPESTELFGRAALEAAKQKRPTQKASMKTQMIICEGEGRSTRECELIWWPIYEHSQNGNLTVRIFIGKIYI